MELLLGSYINKKMWDPNIKGMIGEMVGTGCGVPVMDTVRKIIRINKTVEHMLLSFNGDKLKQFIDCQKEEDCIDFDDASIHLRGKFSGIMSATIVDFSVEGFLVDGEDHILKSYQTYKRGFHECRDYVIDGNIDVKILDAIDVIGNFTGICTIIDHYDVLISSFEIENKQIYMIGFQLWIAPYSNEEIIDKIEDPEYEKLQDFSSLQREILGEEYCEIAKYVLDTKCLPYNYDIRELPTMTIGLGESYFNHDEDDDVKLSHWMYEEIYDYLSIFRNETEPAAEDHRLPCIPTGIGIKYTIIRETYRIATLMKSGLLDVDSDENINWENYVSCLARRAILEYMETFCFAISDLMVVGDDQRGHRICDFFNGEDDLGYEISMIGHSFKPLLVNLKKLIRRMVFLRTLSSDEAVAMLLDNRAELDEFPDIISLVDMPHSKDIGRTILSRLRL